MGNETALVIECPSAPEAADEHAPKRLEVVTAGAAARSRFGPRAILLLTAVLGLHSALVWVDPAADPPLGYSRDLSLSIDGYWYLARARAWAEGGEGYVDPHYRKPWVTLPGALIFEGFGVSLASARGLSFIASLGTLLLLSALLRRRFGVGAALIGTTLLAFDPVWLVFVRSPVIYPWVSFWMLAAIALGSASGWGRWIAGVVLAGVVAVGLKALVLLVVPALGVEGWRHLRGTRLAHHRRWVAAFGVGALLAVGGLGPQLAPAFWGQITNYLGWSDGSVFEYLFTFESRSRLFSAVPMLSLVALGSVLFALGVGPARRGRRAPERALHVTLWTTLPLFAVAAYCPLRYLLYGLPIIVFLFMGTLMSLAHLGLAWRARGSRLSGEPSHEAAVPTTSALRLRPFRFRGARTRVMLGVGLGGIGFVYVWHQSTLAVTSSEIPSTGLGFVCVGATAMAAVLAGWWRSPRHAIVIAALMLLPALARVWAVAESRDHTLQRANAEVAAMIPTGARLGGPFAHALTIENGIDAVQMSSLHYGGGKLRDRVRELGCTHIAFDEPEDNVLPQIFASEGLPIDFIARLAIRGTAVVLYRVREASLARSDFEGGVEAIAIDPTLAMARLREAARSFPNAASIWYRLGEAALRSGDPRSGHAFLERAVQCDPGHFDAHVALAHLARTAGQVDAAERHLQAARSALPGHSTPESASRNRQ
ncbi:MAG: tetratricopeptide repeat protein [Planctomycetota bacterium]